MVARTLGRRKRGGELRGSTTLVLCPEPLGVSAVVVAVRRGVARVERTVTADRPDSVDPSEPIALGSWIRTVLDGSGVRTRRTVLALPRGHVVLKRVAVPPALRPDEVPGAARLALLRAQAVPVQDVAFDCVPPPEPEGDDPPPSERTVLAGALPADRLRFVRELAQAAGLKLVGVRLRAQGTAELVRRATPAGASAAPTLAIVTGPGWGEFVLVEHGELHLVREADIARDLSVEQSDRAVAVEAARTVLLRAGTPRVAVLGDEGDRASLAEACASATERPAEVLEPPDTLWAGTSETLSAAPGTIGRLAPLAGLALAEDAGRPGLDFLNPTRPPDPRSAVRRAAMLGAALIGIVAAGGWLLAQRELDALQARVSAVRQQKNELDTQVVTYFREDARLRHAQRWAEGDPDWLAHLATVRAMLPPGDQGVLDALGGSVEASAVFRPTRSNSYHEGRWSVSRTVRLDLEGRVRERAVANALRERLIASGVYRLTTQGADTPDRFSFVLMTPEGVPPAHARPDPNPAERPGTGEGGAS